jgi:acetyltransferase-like isoleucine patch superfamily enzyme
VRSDHHPFWVQRALALVTQRWAERFLLPQFDAVGAEPRFSGPHYIHLQGRNIRVGDHFHAFGARHDPLSLAVDPYDGGNGSGEIVIGDYCVLSPGVRIRSASSVRIGDNCMLAERCYVTDADWHDVYHRIYPGKTSPVRIGNNVWLADSVTVCKGVEIGDNSVVGAASVVTKDVPANTIVAGNPARPIGEIDPHEPSSRREHLFTGGRPYDDFKADYDRERLRGNTLLGWLRALTSPDDRS